MSTQLAEDSPQDSGFPELSALGKRIELLRIERGLSKQRLAREAGTSRQQLWRVMTGKSELTASLCHRLCEVLQTTPRFLREGELDERGPGSLRLVGAASAGGAAAHETPEAFATFAASPELLERALTMLPADAAGRRLRRELLNCVEEVAREEGVRLPGAFFELRGRVINGEL
jgi:transcriptional regulator with XRE-family HTH domain